ncbi:MAG TPA: biosynthetic peptidoglycan transglycosylase [Gemmatimonadales bacterium]|nr:biosynthetic peptidoglycan transglycosylase [Gemmatimonadales bacterium]
MAVAKARIARRVVLGTAALAAVWVFGVWPPPIWWRDHTPRCTAMMRLHAPACPRLKWTKLDAVAPIVPRLVIIGEDSRFRTHHGIDFAEIGDALGVESGRGVWATVSAAWRHRDRLRGASTITQQLAKNLYLSPSRNPLRKVKEAVTAWRLELALSKDRILELYLNVAEWGAGVWGVTAASEEYFAVPPSRLTEWEAGALAATLPFPLSSNPVLRPARMLARRDLILARYHGADVYIPPVDEIEIPPPEIPPIDVPLIPVVIDTLMDSIKVVPDSTRDTTRDTSSVHQP